MSASVQVHQLARIIRLLTPSQVYSLEGKVLYEKNTPVPKVEGNSGVEVEKLHGQYLKDFPVVFVKLQLLNNVSKTVSLEIFSLLICLDQ